MLNDIETKCITCSSWNLWPNLGNSYCVWKIWAQSASSIYCVYICLSLFIISFFLSYNINTLKTQFHLKNILNHGTYIILSNTKTSHFLFLLFFYLSLNISHTFKITHSRMNEICSQSFRRGILSFLGLKNAEGHFILIKIVTNKIPEAS